MQITSNSIKLDICKLFNDAYNNILKMIDHSTCSIWINFKHLLSSFRTHDIKNMRDKSKHILINILLKHWDDNEMQIMKFAIDVNSNAIIEVGFVIMSWHIIHQWECSTESILGIENSEDKLEIAC